MLKKFMYFHILFLRFSLWILSYRPTHLFHMIAAANTVKLITSQLYHAKNI